MGTPNSTEAILAGAKKTLANASKFTQSAEGKPDSSFAPKKEMAPESEKPSYNLAAKQRGVKPGGSVHDLVNQAGHEETDQALKNRAQLKDLNP